MIFNSKQLEELENIHDSTGAFEEEGEDDGNFEEIGEAAMDWRRGLIEERPVVRGTPPDTGSAIVCWHRDHGDLGICLAVRTLRLKALYFLATTEPPTIFSQEPLGT